MLPDHSVVCAVLCCRTAAALSCPTPGWLPLRRDPVVLPFYHSGMGSVLPRRSRLPRSGHQVGLLLPGGCGR